MMAYEFYKRFIKIIPEDKVFFSWNDLKIPTFERVNSDFKIIESFYLDHPDSQKHFPFEKEYVAFLYAVFGINAIRRRLEVLS